MATKLKNLKVTSVDFVPAGANPDAHIKLFKSKTPEPPTQDGILKSFAEKLLKTVQSVFKEAKTFNEEYTEEQIERQTGAVRSELWEMSYALHDSIMSIITDQSISPDEASDLIRSSLDDFMGLAEKATDSWANRSPLNSVTKAKVTPEQLADLKSRRDALDKLISETEATQDADDEIDDERQDDDPTVKGKCKTTKTKKEVIDTMQIEKSKMTPDELKVLEEFEKKYGTPDADPTPATTGDEGGIAKLHPEVAKKLQEVDDIKKSLELERMTVVAKKYEVIGKKSEELAPKLLDIRKAGETAYNDYIAILDEQVTMQAGVFKEHGSNNSGTMGTEWQQIEKAATDLIAADQKLSRAQAIDKACQLHPELVAAYEKSI